MKSKINSFERVKSETNNFEKEKINLLIGLRYAKVVCFTLLGVVALCGMFFGNEGLIGLGVIMLIITFLMLMSIGDKF